MAALMTIELTGLRFHAFHGLYEEEKIAGNEFEVSLYVSYRPQNEIVNELSGTINYAVIFDIVKKRMQERTDLLETIAMSLAEEIRREFAEIQKVDISIKKLHPPIAGFSGNVAARYQKEF
jgi:dihydroneopterin aldolase